MELINHLFNAPCIWDIPAFILVVVLAVLIFKKHRESKDEEKEL